MSRRIASSPAVSALSGWRSRKIAMSVSNRFSSSNCTSRLRSSGYRSATEMIFD
ncbi:MAG TPA: hypothetical protein VJ326_09010 [Thermoplasmata archaeon]|nr:hypothetical protein [Thermoplasmata archaeon]